MLAAANIPSGGARKYIHSESQSCGNTALPKVRAGFGVVLPKLPDSIAPETIRSAPPTLPSSRTATERQSGAEGDRTLYLLHAMQALSQMSYGPF